MLKPNCIHCIQALSAPARFKIYQNLIKSETPMTVNQLVRLTKLRQPTVSFHVNAMVESGLIERRKVGRSVLCSAKPHCKDCPFGEA
jgi:DNA-binding transcriptional ArsR family regulator